jgi:hypothetical protein
MTDAAVVAPPPEATPTRSSEVPAPAAPAPEPAPIAAAVEETEDPSAAIAALEAFHWSGYIQGQYEAHDDSENEVDGTTLGNMDRFLVRRGRLKLQYDGIEHARFMIQIDATSTGVSLRDAVASVMEPWTGWDFELAAGLFKNPFGFEVQQSSGDRVFPERSLLGRTLYPGERDVGVRLAGKHDLFRFALALMNGDPIGERAFPGRDPSSYKDLVGRVGIATSLVDVGVSGHVGTEFQPGTAETDAETIWVDANEDAVVDTAEVTTTPAAEAVSSENATRLRLGFDAQLHHEIAGLGRLEVLAEVAYAQRGETDLAGKQGLFSGYLGVVQHWQDRAGIGLRAEMFDPNLDAGDDRVIVLEPVLLAYPVPAVRLSLAYDIVLEEAASVDNNVFTARMQVKF